MTPEELKYQQFKNMGYTHQEARKLALHAQQLENSRPIKEMKDE